MSGIIGSKLNHRGSGLVGSLGTDGQVLTSAGAGVSAVYEGAAAGGTSWQSVETGSTLTAVAGNGYPVNTTAQACTVTLPAGSVGDTIEFVDYAGTWDTNSVTLTADGSEKIKGSTDDGKLNVERQGIKIVYVDATQGWVAATGVNDDTAPAINPPAYEIEFLVVAGGGGGGADNYTAGGGAGGYIESTQSVQSGFAITIAVGDGGTGGTTGPTYPTNGGDSSISGSGLTDKTADGGGAGGFRASGEADGADGGSGGGGKGGASTTGGSATAGQGYDGGDGYASGPNYGCAGGGGSSEVGANGTNTTGGDGGDGTANDITGSSVTYAGGGGGGTYVGGTVGSGGTGGGGDAGASGGDNVGADGTDGLGGGGGGASWGSGPGADGGDGGSGIVLLRMLTANYSTTVSGNETPIVDGDYTVLKYINTAGGSYTT